MWYSVRITIRCGDGVHSIAVSPKTFAEIRDGKEITLQGDGFATEEGIVPTEWEAFLDDLQQTLDKFAVPQSERGEIKAIVTRHEPILSFKRGWEQRPLSNKGCATASAARVADTSACPTKREHGPVHVVSRGEV
jgi:hypothetical protein